MRVIIRPDYEQVSTWAATYIKTRILSFAPTPERPFVLGLPTGSSPIGTYVHVETEASRSPVASFCLPVFRSGFFFVFLVFFVVSWLFQFTSWYILGTRS